MAKFDIKTVKPKFVVTTSPDNKIEVVVNKPIITSKRSKSFFQLKNTGGPRGLKGDKGDKGDAATIAVASTSTGAAGTDASVVNEGTSTDARLAFTIPKGDKGDTGYSPSVVAERKSNYVQIDTINEHFTTTAKVYDGEDGEAATVTVGSTTTGDAGTEASVVNSGTTSAAVLDFVIPKGDKGDTGSTGAPGSDGYSPVATVSKSGDTATITITDKNGTTTATVSDGQDGATGSPGQAATIAVDSTSTLPAGSSATVTNVGTSSAARLAFGIPKGDTGAAGADGDAATIAVGQVETLQPNQSAYVTNVGTSSAAIFNIGIPKGDKGDAGAGTGDMLASTYDPNSTVAAAGGIPDYVAGELPTVNNATLTIQKNSTNVATFTANASSNVTANITVPTATSDLSNDSGFITSSSLPTKTSDLTNDGSDGTSTYVEADDLATVATSGAYSDLSGTPNLATVATSGSYNDLSNKPTIPAAQVNSDWNANSGVAEILNKPSLATVATSGSYTDLSNKPTIPTVNDATLTITQNGVTAGTFSANASSASTVALTDTTYSAFTGATSSVAGSTGLVPAPTTSDPDKFLKGDGTWATPNAGGVFDCYVNKTLSGSWTGFWDIYDSTSYTTELDSADISNQLLAGKRVVVHTSDSTPYTFEIISQYDDSLPCYDFIVSFGGVLKRLHYIKLIGWDFAENIVNDATLTIQHNGTNVQTFTANASSNATANVETIWADPIASSAAITPLVQTAMIADGAVTASKTDFSAYGLNATVQIGTDVDDNTPVYRTTLGSNSLAISTSTWVLLGNLFGSGTGTVKTIYSLNFVLRDSAGTNFCAYGYDGGTAGGALGTSRPLLAKVLSNGNVLIACANDNFSAAKVRVTVEYTKN